VDFECNFQIYIDIYVLYCIVCLKMLVKPVLRRTTELLKLFLFFLGNQVSQDYVKLEEYTNFHKQLF